MIKLTELYPEENDLILSTQWRIAGNTQKGRVGAFLQFSIKQSATQRKMREKHIRNTGKGPVVSMEKEEIGDKMSTKYNAKQVHTLNYWQKVETDFLNETCKL